MGLQQSFSTIQCHLPTSGEQQSGLTSMGCKGSRSDKETRGEGAYAREDEGDDDVAFS